jgi:sugar phosphate isomerase/epimerase
MKKLLLPFFIFLGNMIIAQKDWKLSIQTWTFHKYSLLEAVDKADSLGVKYLEVYPGQRVGAGYNGPFSYRLSNEERTRLKNFLKKKGIKVIALGVVDKEYYHPDNLEQFFIFCRDMEIPFLTAEPEPADLVLFNQLAEKYKMKVALHCHPKPTSHYWHPDSTLAAMKGRKNIGAWPDMGHWARNGVNTVDGLKKMEGKLWGLHFKDVNKFADVNAADTLYGKGVSNLSGVLKELKRQNFKGIISIEYEANEDSNMEDMRMNIEFYKKEIMKLRE